VTGGYPAAERKRVGVPPVAVCREFVGLESWEATIGRKAAEPCRAAEYFCVTAALEDYHLERTVHCDLEGAVVREQSLVIFPESLPEGLVHSFGRTPKCVQTIPRLVQKPQREAEC